ncbi:MAG: hypothetical protein J3Q66DRAFT_427074, partial [Benniella sp.]
LSPHSPLIPPSFHLHRHHYHSQASLHNGPLLQAMDASDNQDVSPVAHSALSLPSTATNKRSCGNIEEDFNFPTKLSWFDRDSTEDAHTAHGADCQCRPPDSHSTTTTTTTTATTSYVNNRHSRSPIITIISLSEEDLKADDNHKATHNGRRNYHSRPGMMHHGENNNKGFNDDIGRNSDPGPSMIRPPQADNRNSNAHRVTSHESRYNQYRDPSALSFNPRMAAHYEYRRYNNGPRHFMPAHPGINHWHHPNNHHMANYGARPRYGSGNTMTSPPSADYRNANNNRHGGFNHEGGRRHYGPGRPMIYPLGPNNQSTGHRMTGYNENRRIYSSRSSTFRPDANDENTVGYTRSTNFEDRRNYGSRSTFRPDANDESNNSHKTTNFEDRRSYGPRSFPDHPPGANCTLNGLENGHGCSPIITIISLSEADLISDNRKAANNETRHGNTPEPSAALPLETNNHTVSRHEKTHHHGPGHLANDSPGDDDDSTDSYDGVDNQEIIDYSTFEPLKLDRNTLEQDIDKKLSSLKHVIGTGGPLFTNRQYLTFFQSD